MSWNDEERAHRRFFKIQHQLQNDDLTPDERRALLNEMQSLSEMARKADVRAKLDIIQMKCVFVTAVWFAACAVFNWLLDDPARMISFVITSLWFLIATIRISAKFPRRKDWPPPPQFSSSSIDAREEDELVAQFRLETGTRGIDHDKLVKWVAQRRDVSFNHNVGQQFVLPENTIVRISLMFNSMLQDQVTAELPKGMQFMIEREPFLNDYCVSMQPVAYKEFEEKYIPAGIRKDRKYVSCFVRCPVWHLGTIFVPVG